MYIDRREVTMPGMEKRKADVSHRRLNDTPQKTEEMDRWKEPHVPRSPSHIFSYYMYVLRLNQTIEYSTCTVVSVAETTK